jgi:hypothetical protein
LRLVRNGAQRASRRSSTGRIRLLGALLVATIGLGLIPTVASAATIRVVIVVGPVGSLTSSYLYDGRALAAQAKSYGASVTEIFSPNATWSRVKAAAQGANLLIYLGHGNGWPSPYAPYRASSMDGLGLNSALAHGNYDLRYYGASYLIGGIRLATNAVVILNHLCYSAGNSEPGLALPTKTVAKERIDNFGSTFLKMGARAVFAEARDDARYILSGLFRTSRTMSQIFWSSPKATHTYSFTFASAKVAGDTAISDPYARSHYYRSVVGNLAMTAATWR